MWVLLLGFLGSCVESLSLEVERKSSWIRVLNRTTPKAYRCMYALFSCAQSEGGHLKFIQLLVGVPSSVVKISVSCVRPEQYLRLPPFAWWTNHVMNRRRR